MAGKIILADTSLLIDYFRKTDKINSRLIALFDQGYDFYISAISLPVGVPPTGIQIACHSPIFPIILHPMKQTVAIDMDGVIADVEAHFIHWYERDYGDRFSKDILHGVPEDDAFPVKGAVRKFVTTPGFFSTVPVMEGAVEAVQKIMETYEVYIVSAAMEFPQSLPEKYAWLNEHFPFIGWRNIIFCGDKSIINTDYLIDDHCKNLDVCKGKPIMFTAGHNINHTHHKRGNNWTEILALLELEW